MLNDLFSIPARMDANARAIYDRMRERMKALGLRWPSGLAKALNESPQRMNNWKTRGVPPAMHIRVATALGWSVDQLLGNEPTTDGAQWPFPGIPAERFRRLSPGEQMIVQGRMIDAIIKIEAENAAKSGPARRPRPPRSARG